MHDARAAGGVPATAPGMIVQHDDDAPDGLLGDWLRARGTPFELLRRDRGAPLPRVADALARPFLVVLGSEAHAHEAHGPLPAWAVQELALLRACAAADVPVFGICFGAQLLARALGGRVGTSAHGREVGWLSFESADPARLPQGPWAHWHVDAFSAPLGAEVLAARGEDECRAFVRGRALAVQFHPEATPAIVDGWMRSAACGPVPVEDVDPDALARAGAEAAPAAARAADALFRFFFETLARV
ncbi:MAG TPA: type 1 glutamine amidotransferase [Conexibacter sp.]|nr:type 1 glutamine amidotransferase [Conexibacter sp.]